MKIFKRERNPLQNQNQSQVQTEYICFIKKILKLSFRKNSKKKNMFFNLLIGYYNS